MITYSGNVQRAFDWDCLNRLLDKKASGVVQASYNYRADGMRVGKYVASGNKTTVYRYDGQMGMEDVETGEGQKRPWNHRSPWSPEECSDY